MSQTLTAYVSLWAENGELVSLAPGDELPEWAEGKVGDHCLTLPDDANAAPGIEADAEVAPAPDAKRAKTTETPDFTSAAPRRGRPRK